MSRSAKAAGRMLFSLLSTALSLRNAKRIWTTGIRRSRVGDKFGNGHSSFSPSSSTTRLSSTICVIAKSWKPALLR